MGAIGDVIMALPVARVLYEKGFEIDWICGTGVHALLECYLWVHPIVVNDRAILIGTPLQRARHIVRLWREIAFKKYDLSATLYYDWRFRILALPAWVSQRVTLSNSSRMTTLLAGRSHTDEFGRISLHIEDTCRPQGLHPLRPEKLPPSPLPKITAERRIAIVPGGAANFHFQQTLRRWPVENYAALATSLRKRNWEIVLIGGPDDSWVKTHFQDLDVTDCIGKLSLPEVISVCDSCDAVISHDTGPLHLAGLSRACLIGIFGPTNPSHFLPRRNGVLGLWGGHDFACRPCYDGQSFAPCKLAGCMREVTPDMVIAKLDLLIHGKFRECAESWQIISIAQAPVSEGPAFRAIEASTSE